MERSLTTDDARILDILRDDVQPLPLISSAIESDATPYRQGRFSREIIHQGLFETLTRLVKDGLLVAYRELAASDHFELAALPQATTLRDTDWYGLTRIGLSIIEDSVARGAQNDSAVAEDGDWGKIWRPDSKIILGRLAWAYGADPKHWVFQGSISQKAKSRNYYGAVVIKMLLRSHDGNLLVLVHFVRQGEPFPFAALVRGYFRFPITGERFETPGLELPHARA